MNKFVKVSFTIIFILSFFVSYKGINAKGYTDTSSLTTQEIKLYSAHPKKALTAKECAETANDAAQDLYKDYTLWQGNGDAFRHAYWSALMTKKISKDFAWKAGLAHEGLDTDYEWSDLDDDAKMDVNNNYRGRQIGENNSSKKDSELKKMMITQCSNGGLKRIRTYTKEKSGKNVAKICGKYTKYVGYYVKTTDGGLK